MTCDELDAALCSGDAALIAAARDHARQCGACAAELRFWEDLSAAARSLHREWESPALWPRIAAQMRAESGAESRNAERAWWTWLMGWRFAAAVLMLAILVPISWYAWSAFHTAPPPVGRTAASERLLNEQALSEVERAEAEYIRAIDALSARATAVIDEPTSPLSMALRERLIAIDAAIVECRAALERNRFNAHLRRELLSIYREKQRTLEQMLESVRDVS
jgi:hypothetical protein